MQYFCATAAVFDAENLKKLQRYCWTVEKKTKNNHPGATVSIDRPASIPG